MVKPMSAKRRMELEIDVLAFRKTSQYFTLAALKNAAEVRYNGAKVFLDGDIVRFAAADLDLKHVHGFAMDAVAAATVAIDILELVKGLFPGDFDVQAERRPPDDTLS